MKPFNKTLFASLTLIALLAAACGSFSPPPECTEGLGGTADEALFAQYFTSMELVSAASGEPGAPRENGAEFPVSEPLAVNVSAVAEVSVRFCVQGFYDGGVIADDLTSDIVPGDNQVHLDTFDTAANYVVRVIVDDVLVKNLPFTLQ